MHVLLFLACQSFSDGTRVSSSYESGPIDSGTLDTAFTRDSSPFQDSESTEGPEADEDDEDDAVILSVSFPTGLTCGEEATASVTVRNTGTATWTHAQGYKLGAIGDEDPFLSGDVRVWLDVEDIVPPQSDHTFLVPLEGPETTSSLTTDWQMVHEGVRWFGEGTAATIAVECDEETETSGYPLPLPDMSHVVEEIAADRPDLLADSCLEDRGSWDFLDMVVDRLRKTDTRWGYNWKRGNVGDASQDVVDYHYGPGPSEESPDVYIIDMIVNHCSPNPEPGWLDQTQATADAGTIGLWTGRGRF